MTTKENNVVLAIFGPPIIIGLMLLCMIFPFAYVALPGAALLIDSRTGKYTATATILAIGIGLILTIGVGALPIALPLIFVPIVAFILLKIKISSLEALIASAATAAISIVAGLLIISVNQGQSIAVVLIDTMNSMILNIDEGGILQYLLSSMAVSLETIYGQTINIGEIIGSAASVEIFSPAVLAEKLMPFVTDFIKFGLAPIIIRSSLYMGLLAYGLPAYLARLRRLKNKPLSQVLENTPTIPQFKTWDVPTWIKFPLILAMVGAIIAQLASNNEIVLAIAYTVDGLVLGVGAIEGLALLHFWFGKRKISNGGSIALIVIIFALASTVVSYLGLFDMIMGLRRFWSHREKIIKDLKDQIDKQKDDSDKGGKK